jgi:hypothetical protein
MNKEIQEIVDSTFTKISGWKLKSLEQLQEDMSFVFKQLEAIEEILKSGPASLEQRVERLEQLMHIAKLGGI